MKKTKTIKALLLAALMLLGLALTACGGEGESEVAEAPAAAGYQVKVVDALGSPYTSGVIVRFMQNGQQVAMDVVNEEGIVNKELADGEYTVELQNTNKDAEYYYEAEGLTLNGENKALEIVLSKLPGGEKSILNAYSLLSDGTKEHEAPALEAGCSYVTLIPGERNYFVFTPVETGTYEITVAGDEGQVGYYGMPSYVQKDPASQATDNVVTISVNNGNIGTAGAGTSSYVFGLDAAEGVTEGIFCITRVGDPQWSIEDEPWLVYSAKTEPAPFTLTLEAGQSLKMVDVTKPTDTYKLVLNEADGFYHIGAADGPLMYVKLCPDANGKEAPYICFEAMVGDGTGDKGVTALRKYYFDDEGNFVKKEEYTECMISYNVCCDETYGVYPLTEDLVYMIQNGGEQQGWWNPDHPSGTLFRDENGNIRTDINYEIAWMFACCYIEG